MKRSKKEIHVGNMVRVFSSFQSFLVVNFHGVDARTLFFLRRELKAVNSGLIVSKNSLSRIALDKVNKVRCLDDKFSGPTMVFYSNDIIDIAKVLAIFMKKNKDKMSIVCGVHQEELLSERDVSRFASLPSLDEVRLRIIYAIYKVPLKLLLMVKVISGKN